MTASNLQMQTSTLLGLIADTAVTDKVDIIILIHTMRLPAACRVACSATATKLPIVYCLMNSHTGCQSQAKLDCIPLWLQLRALMYALTLTLGISESAEALQKTAAAALNLPAPSAEAETLPPEQQTPARSRYSHVLSVLINLHATAWTACSCTHIWHTKRWMYCA